MHGGGRILKPDLDVSELRINARKLGDTIHEGRWSWSAGNGCGELGAGNDCGEHGGKLGGKPPGLKSRRYSTARCSRSVQLRQYRQSKFRRHDQTGRRTDAPSNLMLSRAKLHPATSPASWKTRLPGGRTRLECPPFLMFTLLQVTPSKSLRVGEHVPNGTTFQKPRFAQHPSVECGDADAGAYKVCIFCRDGPFPSLQIRECGFRSLSRILA
jgi:hypothetical protein